VTSKPDMYPLVISYGDNGKGTTGGNYLMVQYFRNYIVRPVGKHKQVFELNPLCSKCNMHNHFRLYLDMIE
jgi:hypothetical protein